MSSLNKATLNALAGGRYANSFCLYGIHRENGRRIIRTIQPQAESLELLLEGNADPLAMKKVHSSGIFEAVMPSLLAHQTS